MNEPSSSHVVQRTCCCGGTSARVIGCYEIDARTGSVVGANTRPDVATWSTRLVECESCGTHALEPIPTRAQLNAAYSREYYGSSRRKFVAPIAALVGAFQGSRARLVSRWVAKGGRLLDVGCGNGGFLIQMAARGYRVSGTEWTREAADRVPIGAGIPVHVGDLLGLQLEPATFDAVTLWHVFEHLANPQQTLEAIRALLVPGGHLFLALPNVESAQARRYGSDWFHHDPPRHLWGFGPRSLSGLLEATGFRVESMGTGSLEQNPFGEIQSALNARGFPRDRLYGQLKGLSRDRAATRWADLARLAVRLPMAVLRDIYDTARGRGATLTVVARRE